MAKNITRHITHIKSKVVENSSPKLPASGDIELGEIAVNYAKGYETLSIKNESGDVVTFSEDKNIGKKGKLTGYAKASSASAVATSDTINTAIGKLEKALDALSNKVDKTEYATFSAATNTSIEDLSGQSETVAAALNDLNSRKLDASAYTPTDLSNYYTKNETSGKTEISNALGGKVNTATFTGHTADTTLHFSGNEKRNLDALATNIEAISGISATKVSNWDGAASNSHTHTNKTYLDGITGNVGTMAYQNANSYSSATQVSTALADKLDKTDAFSGDYNDLTNKPILIEQLTISSNISSTCSITGSSNSGKEETIIYVNDGSSAVTVTVPTTYKTPDGAAIELTCEVGDYCEVNYLNVSGTIYARGL